MTRHSRDSAEDRAPCHSPLSAWSLNPESRRSPIGPSNSATLLQNSYLSCTFRGARLSCLPTPTASTTRHIANSVYTKFGIESRGDVFANPWHTALSASQSPRCAEANPIVALGCGVGHSGCQAIAGSALGLTSPAVLSARPAAAASSQSQSLFEFGSSDSSAPQSALEPAFARLPQCSLPPRFGSRY